jgi:hypothetical protein
MAKFSLKVRDRSSEGGDAPFVLCDDSEPIPLKFAKRALDTLQVLHEQRLPLVLAGTHTLILEDFEFGFGHFVYPLKDNARFAVSLGAEHSPLNVLEQLQFSTECLWKSECLCI